MFKRIFHFQLQGTIDYKMVERVKVVIRKRTLFKPVLIAVSVTSNQGSLIQAKSISQIFQYYAKTRDVPLYTFAEDACMNAALLLLCQGNKVFANPFSLFGETASNFRSFGLGQAAPLLGIQQATYTSSQNRELFNQFKDLKEEEKQQIIDMLKAREDKLYKELVEYRKPYMQDNKITNEVLIQTMRDNPMLSSQEMLKLGLIDEITTMEDLLALRYQGIKVIKMLSGQPQGALSTRGDIQFVDKGLESF